MHWPGPLFFITLAGGKSTGGAMARTTVDGRHFKDEHGRTLMLRGVNLGGSSKVPARPAGGTHLRDDFFEHRTVSFVGRPFPLDEADEHFRRLRAWGFRFLRLLVTWEAVEHAGPGQYDEEYLAYLREVAALAGEYGLQLLIDPHQDVWSRFSGGDGAPGWTFESAGLDITSFHETGAAIVHQTHGDPFPRMIWPTNIGKLAAATMFTLFFGGGVFAPRTRIDGDPVDEYLQRHYINAMVKAAEALSGLDNVVGYDTMNEPLSGYIGLQDLNQAGGMVHLGPTPTALQGMLLGAGMPQSVPVIGLSPFGERVLRNETLNPEARKAWLPGRDCIWRENGIWDQGPNGEGVLLRPEHFARVEGKPVDFDHDFYRPFANRFARAIRAVDPDAVIFLESEPRHGSLSWGSDDAPNVVYAPHWYDGFTLYLKTFKRFLAVDHDSGKILVGPRRIKRSFHEQLERRVLTAGNTMEGIPILLGEFGIPFDLDHGRGFRTGDFSAQAQALDRSFQAIESNLLSCTLWNYTSDNDNEHGDQWNGEDLSIFSRDQQRDPSDLNSGGRALTAVVRPYPLCTAGQPLTVSFDMNQRVFRYSYKNTGAIAAPTEIYIPTLHYTKGCRIHVSDGSYDFDPVGCRLQYWHDPGFDVHTITVVPA
jgi:hypothetical protein